jgi:hypothetical protein
MTSTWYSSRRVAETHSGYKVLVEEGTDRSLGAHILGGEAAEVINLFALAIRRDACHRFKAHAVSVSDEWLKSDAHALETSKREHDLKNDTNFVNSHPCLYAYEDGSDGTFCWLVRL